MSELEDRRELAARIMDLPQHACVAALLRLASHHPGEVTAVLEQMDMAQGLAFAVEKNARLLSTASKRP